MSFTPQTTHFGFLVMVYDRVKRFYTKIFTYIKITLNVQERPVRVDFLILLISAVICKQRKLYEKEVTQNV